MKGNLILSIVVLLILTLPFTFGNGGDTYIENFSKCEDIRITFDGTLPIDDGEYVIQNNCTGSNNIWICNCSNDWEFKVTFLPNTINNYTIEYDWNYTETKSTGGGGSRKRNKIVILPYYENESRNETSNITGIEEPEKPDDEIKPGIEDSKNEDVNTKETTTDTQQDTTAKSSTTETEANEQDVSLEDKVATETVAGMPWWMIVVAIILLVFGATMIIIYFAFREPKQPKKTISANEEINNILSKLK